MYPKEVFPHQPSFGPQRSCPQCPPLQLPWDPQQSFPPQPPYDPQRFLPRQAPYGPPRFMALQPPYGSQRFLGPAPTSGLPPPRCLPPHPLPFYDHQVPKPSQTFHGLQSYNPQCLPYSTSTTPSCAMQPSNPFHGFQETMLPYGTDPCRAARPTLAPPPGFPPLPAYAPRPHLFPTPKPADDSPSSLSLQELEQIQVHVDALKQLWRKRSSTLEGKVSKQEQQLPKAELQRNLEVPLEDIVPSADRCIPSGLAVGCNAPNRPFTREMLRQILRTGIAEEMAAGIAAAIAAPWGQQLLQDMERLNVVWPKPKSAKPISRHSASNEMVAPADLAEPTEEPQRQGGGKLFAALECLKKEEAEAEARKAAAEEAHAIPFLSSSLVSTSNLVSLSDGSSCMSSVSTNGASQLHSFINKITSEYHPPAFTSAST